MLSAFARTRYSDWILIDQPMIDRFADTTFDRQFIHVDSHRAAKTPFGGTRAHGFLVLGLLPSAYPMHSGSKVRAAFPQLKEDSARPGCIQHSYDVKMEIEHSSKPAVTATWLVKFFCDVRAFILHGVRMSRRKTDMADGNLAESPEKAHIPLQRWMC